ncbi:S26 family signal peptidase [Acidithiobacillus sp. MC6.1]|nr:S26 family signal peptidase [Acidithiobacillus sp. MC6.1]
MATTAPFGKVPDAVRAKADRIRWMRLTPVLVAGAVIAACVVAWNHGDWRLNLSPSEPMGIWSATPITSATRLRPGDVVTLCPNLPVGFHYAWLRAGPTVSNACQSGIAPFIKTIVAGPGDVIHETNQGVTINGRYLSHSRPLTWTTSHPRVRLPQWRGTTTLKPGQFWAYGAGDPAYSFDSRYWGPLHRADVRGMSQPVLTFRFHWTPQVRD